MVVLVIRNNPLGIMNINGNLKIEFGDILYAELTFTPESGVSAKLVDHTKKVRLLGSMNVLSMLHDNLSILIFRKVDIILA